MSNLIPGGSRSTGPRIFGAKAITKACQTKHHDSEGSIADKPHQHNRERERNLRRAKKESSK